MHPAALCIFVLRSLQPPSEEGKGTLINQELGPSRNLEPGQAEHRKAQCFAALSRSKKKWSCPSLGLALHRPCQSLHTAPLAQTLGLPPSPCVSLVTLEDHKDSNFGKRVPSAAKHQKVTPHAAVPLGVPLCVTSTHLWSELIRCIPAPSWSARLASEQLPGSECLTAFWTLQGKLGENGRRPLGQGQGILQAPWRVTAVFFYYSWASLVQEIKSYLCGSWMNSYNKKTENSKAHRQATFLPRLKAQRLQYLQWFCWHWSWTHLLLHPVS